VDLITWVLIATVIVLVVQLVMLYVTLIERKFIGRIQDRIGPNRVGKWGLLQPFADMIKMLVKEDITPDVAHRWVYNLGPWLVVPPAIVVFAVIPVGLGLVASDLSVGLLFFLAVASTAVIPIFMAGWGSRNKYALLGAMRAVAQIVSYEIPQVLSVVGVLLLAGTLSTQELTISQGPLSVPGIPAVPGVWYVWLQPVAFVIFLLATTAEIERTPFDIPEAESEIIAGYHTEYAGIKFGMFYLALYFATIASSALATVLFLGGWQPPIAALAFIPGWIWFGLKTFLMILVFMWLRGTLPRLRVDQLMGFAWKVLVPISLVNLLLAGIVGKLSYDNGFSPLLTLVGFTLANVLLLVITVGLAAWWRNRRVVAALRLDRPAAAAGGA
jgi:NADH-quinone oxidoreductase subunit H